MKKYTLLALSAALVLSACASGPQTDPVFRDNAPAAPQTGSGNGSSPQQPGPQQPAPTPIGRQLTGNALYSQMSGYSYQGCYPDGSTFAETTLADGRLRDDASGGSIIGSWNVSGDSLCYDQNQQQTCVLTYQDNRGLHFYLKDSGAYIASTVCPMDANSGASGGTSQPQPQPPQTPSGMKGTMLRGQELYAQMSGLSYAGCYPDDRRFKETTLADGRVRNDETGDTSSNWSVSGDVLCYINQGSDRPFCVKISRDRDGLHFYEKDSGQYVASTVCPMQL